jgi:hypothetical protein
MRSRLRVLFLSLITAALVSPFQNCAFLPELKRGPKEVSLVSSIPDPAMISKITVQVLLGKEALAKMQVRSAEVLLTDERGNGGGSVWREGVDADPLPTVWELYGQKGSMANVEAKFKLHDGRSGKTLTYYGRAAIPLKQTESHAVLNMALQKEESF